MTYEATVVPYNGMVPRQSTDTLERALAGAAYASALVGVPVVGPLVLLVWKHRESPYVRFHAMQSLVLHLVFIAGIIVGVLTIPLLVGIAILWALGALMPGLLVVMAVSALLDRGWRLPVVGRWTDRILASTMFQS